MALSDYDPRAGARAALAALCDWVGSETTFDYTVDVLALAFLLAVLIFPD